MAQNCNAPRYQTFSASIQSTKNLPDSTTHNFFKVPAGGIINGLYISADETTVAVCTNSAENAFCHMFDTRAFFDKTPHPVGPYYTLRLSTSHQIGLKDFAFNPVIPDMFAVVTSDGKLTNYEIASSGDQFSLKIHGSYNNVCCCSWSPKGKQLVGAKNDGSLVQLRHNMTEAKAIPTPALQELPNPKPKAIFWASSTVFVVAYWTNRVQVVVITLHKTEPTKFVYFDEPCLRNLDEEEFSRTWFCHVPKWNLLLMICRNSPDVAMFGHNESCTEWTYYDIENERAALPIVNKVHTFPTGICINFSSTTPVEKKNHPTRQPSPMVLLANTGGSLIPYYLLNDSNKESVNSPPEELSMHGMRKMLNPLLTTPKNVAATPLAAPTSALPNFSAFSFSQFASPGKPNVNPIAQSTPIAPTNILGNKTVKFSDQPLNPQAPSLSSKPQETFNNPVMPPKGPVELLATAPAAPTSLATVPTSLSTGPASLAPAAPPSAVPSALKKPDPIKLEPSSTPGKLQAELLSQETLSRAFFNEMNSLSKELQELKLHSAKVLALPIGEDKAVTEMRDQTKELLKKMDNVRNDLKTMKTDVHEAEKVLLDALACGTQLRTISVAKDSRISRMDPITQATLRQAQGLANYLERQLIIANNVLDDTYEKFKNEKHTKRRTPTLEMLCRTILNCDKTIEALRDELNVVRGKVDNIKRMRSVRERNNEDLTSLADSLLLVGVSPNETNQSQKSILKDQSFEKIKLLKGYLETRPVIEVTPTKLSPHGESMIVSKLSTILEQSRIECEAEKKFSPATKPLAAPKANNQPRESLGGLLGLRPNVEPSVTPMKPPLTVTSTPFSKPIIEPISPPADTNNPANPSFFQNLKICTPFSASSAPNPISAEAAKKTTQVPPFATMTSGTSASKPFSFDLSKKNETIKSELNFQPAAPSKPLISEVPKAAPEVKTSTGSMFNFASPTPKSESADTGFKFSVTKDAAKDFFSPTTLGFALTKKEEALSTSPSKPQEASPALAKPASNFGNSFNLPSSDAKADTAKKDTLSNFSFSFGGTAAGQGNKNDKPAELPSFSTFNLGDTASQFGVPKAGTTRTEEPKVDAQNNKVFSGGDKVSNAPVFQSPTKKPDEGKPAEVPAKFVFNFGQPGALPAFVSPEKSNESLKSVTRSDSTTSAASETVTTTASDTVTTSSSEIVSENQSSTDLTSAPKDPPVESAKQTPASMSVVADSSETSVTESSAAAPKPAATVAEPAATVPVSAAESTPTSFFAANKPLNFATPPATESSLFGKPPSTGLFGKAPSTSLFGSSGVSAFGQGTAFGSSPGTSLFGGSSTATSTSFFGGGGLTTLATTSASAQPTAATTTKLFGAPATESSVGAFTTTQTATTVAVTSTTASAAPIFGSTSTFGQPSVLGSASSTFTPATSSAFAPSTSSAFAATTSASFPSSTSASAFGAATTAAFTSPTSTTFSATTPSAFGSSLTFGTAATATTTTTAPAFGSTTTTAPAFGAATTTISPAFGATTTAAPAFGATTTAAPAFGATTTAAFGQTNATFEAQPAFGTPQKPQNELFGKSLSTNSGSLFGQKSSFTASPVRPSFFGGNANASPGGFMSGLGQAGAPTTKNVFGGSTFGQSTQPSNLFGSGSSTAFGGQPNYGATIPAGNMTSPATPKPTFGGAPTFGGGSPSGFGSPPTFGSAPVFGGTPAFGSGAQPSAFGNTANIPTFGSIAQNQSPFGMNQPAPGGFGVPASPQTFAQSNTTSPKSAAFTQYRG